MTSQTAGSGAPAPAAGPRAQPELAKRPRAVPAAARRSGFAGTMRSEFTKIRSVRSTYFTLIAFFVAGVTFAFAATAGNRSERRASRRSIRRPTACGVPSPWAS